MPHSPNVSPSATQMTIQVCSYNALTDTATVVYDLNDHVTTTLHAKSLQIQIPPQIETRSGNMRAQGEIVPALQYQNRHISLKVMVQGASSAAVESSVAALINAVKNENLPYCVALAWPGMSTYKYADVVRCKYTTPTDPMEIQSKICRNITLDFECRPGLRGDRVTLQNLVMNPGFEAPAGGGVATTMPTVFSDSFANTNAYSVVSGGAPSLNPANTYVDIVSADAPVRYYRLDESSGTSAYDIGGLGATATYINSPTLGVAGALSGDTDTAITLTGTSSQRVSVPLAGYNNSAPMGNAAMTLECWFKFAANPSTSAFLIGYGDTTTQHHALQLYVANTGKLAADVASGSTPIFSGAACSTGVWHHAVVTWDGTTLTLYLDGTSQGTSTPGNQSIQAGAVCNLGATSAPGNYFTGQLDEVAIYASALSSTRVSAHYTAGHSGASGTVSNAMSIPSGGQVKFGSPAWGAVQTWQTRFRFVTGLSAYFYLHYTDANNYVRAWVNATTLNLEQSVFGSVAACATAQTIALTHEAWYWLQVTQFPSLVGGQPYLRATLLFDNEGVVGSQVAQLGGPTSDAVTAMTGLPEIAASGAALAIGGNYSSVHTVSLFGPGAWLFTSSGAGVASGAWDGQSGGAPSATNANTYPGGMVTSFGCARIETPATGAWSANWSCYAGGSPLGTAAIPVGRAGDTLGVSCVANASGLGAASTVSLVLNEYDVSGNFLRATTVASVAGNTLAGAGWSSLAGTVTTGAFTAYAGLALTAADTTSGSPSATVWFDNAQCWDQTTTGATSMPYCELRFPAAPAQLLLTGLQGDLPAPAAVALGTWFSSGSPFSSGSAMQLLLGVRRQPSVGAQLVGNAMAAYGAGWTPTSIAVLDSSSYGGYYAQATVTSSGWSPRFVSAIPAALSGVFHVWSRFQSAQSVGNLGNVQTRCVVVQKGTSGYNTQSGTDALGEADGSYSAPLAASATWTSADAGQASLPPFATGSLNDPTQTYLLPRAQWVDLTGGGSVCQENWQMLLPIDASLVAGQINNPSNSTVTAFNQWLFVYLDSLGLNSGGQAAWTWGDGFGSQATAQPAVAGGGSGTTGSGPININMAADSGIWLDPTAPLVGANGASTPNAGVAQLSALINVGAAVIKPIAVDMSYAPLYLTLK